MFPVQMIQDSLRPMLPSRRRADQQRLERRLAWAARGSSDIRATSGFRRHVERDAPARPAASVVLAPVGLGLAQNPDLAMIQTELRDLRELMMVMLAQQTMSGPARNTGVARLSQA